MKKFTHRLLPIALCFTLTLGVFAYRPPQAEAIAGVDDAVVIGALLSAFAGGCGLIFSNNGMSSSELAQGLTDKWNEFNESAENAASSFAAWLGFEDTSALLGALSFSGSKLVIPRAIARKFADFTTWLVDNLGIVTDESVSLATLSNCMWAGFPVAVGELSVEYSSSQSSWSGLSSFCLSRGTNLVPSGSVSSTLSLGQYQIKFLNENNRVYACCSVDGGKTFDSGWIQVDGTVSPVLFLAYDSKGVLCFVSSYRSDENGTFLVRTANIRLANWFSQCGHSGLSFDDYSVTNTDFSVTQAPDAAVPDLADDETANPTLSGVGDGTATTVEDLLQQILEQLQTNTLAPALDVAGTETGGDTGTDEDSKPYLPYIPQIFEKIKDLPGTLSNIWETVKGIPAAIAEKIGAFFTTLWGWLSDIITEIKALPAAIAEKVGELFKPDEALVTEIVDAFKGKFGFLSTLNSFVNDLFSLTPESDPPVIWVHLENAESKYGYSYGDKQKILDLSWYQKYKASVDGILSGFLWLGYLWLLFKRAPGILNGMSLADDDAPRSADMPDMLNTPRLGAGDGLTMYRGDGFTMRDKGRRGK